MSHFVKASEGISAESYKHTDTFAKYGEGKGKASSPANWLFQSSTILSALHVLVSSIFLVSVCKRFISNRAAEAYVDNANCTYINQAKQHEPPSQIQNKIQKIAQTWETLLYETEGDLSLSKTYWWLLNWVWEGGKTRLATMQERP
eukprot:11844456-Ditylum_brightwellii.AAC.1